MSIINSSPLRVVPYGANGLNLPGPAFSWGDGDWVEFIANTASIIQIVGVVFPGGYASMQAEIEVGTGTLGNEVVVGCIRIYGPNSGNGGFPAIWIPVPITIGINQRVSLRQSNTSGVIAAALQYIENSDSDNLTMALLTDLPHRANGVTLVFPGTAWADGLWTEITPGINHEISIVGGAFSNINPNCECEIDIGVGPLGSEVVITKLRSANSGSLSGHQWGVDLPATLPVAANSRISARVRGSTSSSPPSNITFALRIYDVSFVIPVIPPNPNTLIVRKVGVPNGITGAFQFSAGGGLIPATFELAPGEQRIYNDLPNGVYSISETVPNNFAVDYNVSNGHPINAINLTGGVTVTVIVTNTSTLNAASGIYKLVKGKIQDTLWINVAAGTSREVKIP